MARLQRQDLTNQFSDLVQQEVKNHNDSILATNVALNEMRLKIDEVRAANEQQGERSRSLFVGLGCQLELIEDTLTKSIENLQRKINDRAAETKADLLSMRKSFDDRETYYMTVDGFEQFKIKIDQWSSNILRAFQVQQDLIRQQIVKIADDTKIAIELVREAVQKSIDQEVEDRKQQDITLDHFAVNFSGLQTEIERVKKRCFIIEKNIENLYTQIERLKAVP